MKKEPGVRKDGQDGGLKMEALRVAEPVRLLSAAGGEGCLFLVQSGGGALYCDQGAGGGQSAGPGSVLLLGRRDCDFAPAGDGPAELLGCRFRLELMSDALKDRLMDPAKAPLVLPGDPAWSGRVRTLLELLADDWQQPGCPGRLYLALLLSYVDRQLAAASAAAPAPRNETVEKICAYLMEHYNQKLNLGSVAARFYLSPYYLSRLFRRVTGQSIVDYINARRIEAACRLLKNSSLGINDVAEATGFSTAAHFRRVFREQVGVSPIQYRKAYRGRGKT